MSRGVKGGRNGGFCERVSRGSDKIGLDGIAASRACFLDIALFGTSGSNGLLGERVCHGDKRGLIFVVAISALAKVIAVCCASGSYGGRGQIVSVGDNKRGLVGIAASTVILCVAKLRTGLRNDLRGQGMTCGRCVACLICITANVACVIGIALRGAGRRNYRGSDLVAGGSGEIALIGISAIKAGMKNIALKGAIRLTELVRYTVMFARFGCFWSSAGYSQNGNETQEYG